MDSNRLGVLFPVRQVVAGSRRKSRRNDNGFVAYDPSKIGGIKQLSPMNYSVKWPNGRLVRRDVCSTFSSVDVDVINCSAEDVS